MRLFNTPVGRRKRPIQFLEQIPENRILYEVIGDDEELDLNGENGGGSTQVKLTKLAQAKQRNLGL